MSDALLGALIGGMAALAGTTLTFALEWLRRARDREYEASGALRVQRAKAYHAFILEVHRAANALARVAEQDPERVEAQARDEAADRVNREVRAALLELEIIAQPETLQCAADLRDIVREFRELVKQQRAQSGDEWQEVLVRYRAKRDEFLGLARREVVPEGR
jgi:hypothetical protein